ncbi:MAG: hypothetical protein ACLP1D_26840 [Xanthobacteraceae bacterium]
MARLDDVVEETKRDFEALNGDRASILVETLDDVIAPFDWHGDRFVDTVQAWGKRNSR